MNLLQDVRRWKLVSQWRWAVGRPAQLAAVWKRYGVGVAVTTKRIAGATINYITHTEAAYVVDSTGHERALFLCPFYPRMFSGRFANSRDLTAAGRRSRLITGLRVSALPLGIVALVLLASPAAASAHLRSGTVAVDYRASISPASTSAYSAQIFQSDRALSVTAKPGHVVVLLGYLGEPVFRLDAVGLWVNAASPTAVVLRLLSKSQRILASTPRWVLQRGRHSVVWADARAQGLPSGVGQGSWSVPVIVDGRRAQLTGELRRFHAPSLWPWFGLLAVLLAAGLSPLVVRRRALAGSAAIVFAVGAAAASLVILVAFALDAYASPGTWIEGLDAIAFLGVGVWGLLRGPAHLRVAAAIGVGLLGLAVALLEGAIFLHPIVLAILPGTAIRSIDVVAMGAGLDAAALGGLFYVETTGLIRGEKTELGPPMASVHGQQ